MERDLWQMAEDLRNIRWPKVWLDRLATALVGLAIAAAGSGADTWHPRSHSVLGGLHYGYFVVAGIALSFSIILYAADKGFHVHPRWTVDNAVNRMVKLGWIDAVEDGQGHPTGSLRQRLLSYWHRRIWDLSEQP